jgi:hypothetical protein
MWLQTRQSEPLLSGQNVLQEQGLQLLLHAAAVFAHFHHSTIIMKTKIMSNCHLSIIVNYLLPFSIVGYISGFFKNPKSACFGIFGHFL